MIQKEESLEIAADVLKQLITLCTAIVATILALFLSNKSGPVNQWWPISTAIIGGLCILASLLFLTDLSATALGSSSTSTRFRLRLFVATWAMFFLCVLVAAGYVLQLAGVV